MKNDDMLFNVDVSVVIGFKDWGTERLLLAVNSLLNSFGNLRGEVIVSDYGTTIDTGISKKIEALGARYIYTETDGTWSRSRALNAGFAISTGRVLVSTDADMLFTPESMEIIGKRVLHDRSNAVVLQCRDLPQRLDSDGVKAEGMNWNVFDAESTLRPRWGMGGMMAVHRDKFLLLRGFDERMEIYGGEDMDFAYRMQRSGCRLEWITDPKVRMYHMWHPPSRSAANASIEGSAAIAINRDITLNDKSFIRNRVQWMHKPADAKPLASVVISTRNRADYISDSINSVLMQTASEDIELLIIDDGSDDHTQEVVQAFQDSRIRYFHRKHSGIASARNFAATVSRSEYTVIHDDDDIMTPNRIEAHFAALEGGLGGTYGGWIDFSNESGVVTGTNCGKEFGFESLMHNGRVLAHATLMLSTDFVRKVGYDELLRSGSDFNLAVRLARSGVELKHTGHIHLIRRLHDRQVTAVDSTVQKASARLTSTLVLGGFPKANLDANRKSYSGIPELPIAGLSDPQDFVQPYLPDHLTKRRIEIDGSVPLEVVEALLPSLSKSAMALVEDASGPEVLSFCIPDATLDDVRKLATAKISYNLTATRPDPSMTSSFDDQVQSFKDLILNHSLFKDTFNSVFDSTLVRVMDKNEGVVGVSALRILTPLTSWTVKVNDASGPDQLHSILGNLEEKELFSFLLMRNNPANQWEKFEGMAI